MHATPARPRAPPCSGSGSDEDSDEDDKSDSDEDDESDSDEDDESDSDSSPSLFTINELLGRWLYPRTNARTYELARVSENT